MIDRRLFTAATLLGLGLGLAGCGGYVADHWPHWAGGLPDDAPPRPGAPGYAEFVAHGQAAQNPGGSPAASSAAQQPAAGAIQTGVQKPPSQPATAAAPASSTVAATPAAPVSQAQVPAPADRRPEDSSVLKGGGLY